MLKVLSICCVLVCSISGLLQGADWPMWKYDAGRSANSPAALPGQLSLQWVRELPKARQAWTDKSNHMLFFDESYEPIVVGKLMILGSMNTDSVTAYSTETGEEKWRFFTDGPVRFAPIAYKGKIYVGSDDGHLYCLKESTGDLIWKKRGGPSDHRILGNKRLVSMWPVRGAPVIHKDVLYFAAGIWPFMGTFIYALEPETGNVIWCNSGNGARWQVQPHGAPAFNGVAPQGYIAATDEVLLVPSSRSAPGAFSPKTGEYLYNHSAFGGYKKNAGGYYITVAGQNFANSMGLHDLETGFPFHKHEGRVSKGVITPSAYYMTNKEEFQTVVLNDREKLDRKGLEGWKFPRNKVKLPQIVGSPHIKAGDSLYCAREDGIISAVDVADSSTPKITWQGNINTQPWTMIAGDDKLFVVSKAGQVFCFGDQKKEMLTYELKETRMSQLSGKTDPRVQHILKNSPRTDGYCVVMGADEKLVSEILSQTKFHVLVSDKSSRAIRALRDTFEKDGQYGDRVAAFVAESFRSGFPPYIANALVVSHTQSLSSKEMGDLFQILRPYGGVAVLSGKKDEIQGHARALKLHNASVEQRGSLCLLKREGSLPGTASWSHQYADAGNSVVSKDQLVKPPFGLLWFGGPTNDQVLPRHGHGPNPVVAGGRIFIEGPDMVRAMDAYTGRLLWQREIKDVGHYYDNTRHHPGANNIGSNIVAQRDAVYVLYKEKCLKLDAGTGETLAEFFLPALEDGSPQNFGSIRIEGDFLVVTGTPLGISVKPESIPVADGKNITLENVQGLRIQEGRGIKIINSHGVGYLPMKMGTHRGKTVPVSDGRWQSFRNKRAELEIGFAHRINIGSGDKVIIEEGKGIVVAAAKGYKVTGGGIENNILYSSASRTLAVLDRHSGKLLWTRDAIHGFRHNAVIASGEMIFCLDKMSDAKENYLMRRGLLPPETSKLIALNIKTGEVKWDKSEDVFGTWLGYSKQHDALVQGGSSNRDRATDEVRVGVVVYRGKDGELFWKDLGRRHAGPLMLRHGEIITNGSGGEAWDLLTGKTTNWSWKRQYGCNTAVAGEHILTFRSGSAGYYDLSRKGGTGNFGGFKSGCTSNLIPADGILTAPDYTRTCVCSYQNQTSLAMVHMPSAEIWTYLPMETPGRVGINFGAPGDRVSSTGTLWTEFPLAGSVPTKREVKAEGEAFRHHSTLFSGKAEAWIGASGLEKVEQVRVKAPNKGSHTVRLYFSEPEMKAQPGDRVFSVSLGQEEVLSDLDIVREAGAPRSAMIKEFKDVQIDASLELTFVATKGEPLICGVEIISNQIASNR